MHIKSVHAQEILDSRGNPTIHCTTLLDDGSEGWAAVPSGASTGKYEAIELRDGDQKRFGGQGVLRAVSNVNDILSKVVVGVDAVNQELLDRKMIEADGTENKSVLGANAILSISMSAARAQAVSEKKSLYQYLSKFNPQFDGIYHIPIPMFNVLNGGKHGNWATDIQEYMLIPVGASLVVQAVQMGVEVYHAIKKELRLKQYSIAVGDEGGFAPQFKSNEEPFQVLTNAVRNAGYEAGKDFYFGIDSAASEFYTNGAYDLKREGKIFTTDELVNYYLSLSKKYPVASMEDVFDQDDWRGFKSLFEKTEGSKQIVGDDLFVTNIKRLQKGIDEKTCNSILIKLNQIGTVSETVQAVLTARKAGMTAIISHRSGETEDSFIADFAVAMGAGQLKAGAPARSERTVKYNRLLQIERELGTRAHFSRFPFSQ